MLIIISVVIFLQTNKKKKRKTLSNIAYETIRNKNIYYRLFAV